MFPVAQHILHSRGGQPLPVLPRAIHRPPFAALPPGRSRSRGPGPQATCNNRRIYENAIPSAEPSGPLEEPLADNRQKPLGPAGGHRLHRCQRRRRLPHPSGGELYRGQRTGHQTHAAARRHSGADRKGRRPGFPGSQPVDMRGGYPAHQPVQRPVLLRTGPVCRPDGRGHVPGAAGPAVPPSVQRPLRLAQGQLHRRSGAAMHRRRGGGAALCAGAADPGAAHRGDGPHRHRHHAAHQPPPHRRGHLSAAGADPVLLPLF